MVRRAARSSITGCARRPRVPPTSTAPSRTASSWTTTTAAPPSRAAASPCRPPGRRRGPLSSGQDVITAVIAGFEVMLRVGLAIRPGVMGRGGHPTGSSGAFGAATTASKLLGLDALTTAYALSSAGTDIVGLSEIPAEGRGHLKRTFGGAAAAAGIRAAPLAASGLAGPLTTLDPEVTWGSFAGFFGVDEERGKKLTAASGRPGRSSTCTPGSRPGWLHPADDRCAAADPAEGHVRRRARSQRCGSAQPACSRSHHRRRPRPRDD